MSVISAFEHSGIMARFQNVQFLIVKKIKKLKSDIPLESKLKFDNFLI